MNRAARLSDTLPEAAIRTSDGVFRAGFSHRGLARLAFPSEHVSRRSPIGATQFSPDCLRWIAQTESALARILEAQTPAEFPPLDLSTGTDFQRHVWRTLRRIPLGKTMTYTEVAKAIGRPQAARAVGQACGANPIPVLIPCHRVLASGGRLGGFSSGLDWKRKLLAREGVRLAGS